MHRVVRGIAYSIGAVFVAILFLVAVQLGYEAYQRATNIWWKSSAEIEAYLIRETPLGSTEDDITDWLRRQGVANSYVSRFVRPVEPDEWVSSYRFNPKARSTALIHTGVAQYGFPFVTTVEVFYLFNQARLVHLHVRKTTDAL